MTTKVAYSRVPILKFPELEKFEDANYEGVKIPYFYDVLKIYRGYRQCYSTDVENDTLLKQVEPTTEEEKQLYIQRFYEYAKWSDPELREVMESGNPGVSFMLERITKMLEDPMRLQFLKMCWFIYQHADHGSQLEHLQLQFRFEHVSRACQQQWTRHRLQVLGIQSQRYISFIGDKDADNVVHMYLPDSIVNNDEAYKIYTDYLNQLPEVVAKIKALGDKKIKDEDIRYLYPNAMCSNGVCSINLRSALHILNERLCSKAQDEIQLVANELAEHIRNYLPFIGVLCAPKCVALGRCPEHKSCGYIRKYIPFKVTK